MKKHIKSLFPGLFILAFTLLHLLPKEAFTLHSSISNGFPLSKSNQIETFRNKFLADWNHIDNNQYEQAFAPCLNAVEETDNVNEKKVTSNQYHGCPTYRLFHPNFLKENNSLNGKINFIGPLRLHVFLCVFRL